VLPDSDTDDRPDAAVDTKTEAARESVAPEAAPVTVPSRSVPVDAPGSRAGQQDVVASGGGTPPPGPGRTGRRFFRKKRHPVVRILQVLALIVLVFIGLIGYSVGGALTRPGNDSVKARVAEWARDHHLGDLVTWLEKQDYERNQPTKGGTANIPSIAGASTNPDGEKPTTPHSKYPEAPTLLAGQALPNEGVWKTVVTGKDNLPAIALTYVRPDDIHTSYVASLMWLDPKLVAGRLHEGVPEGDPGGTWSTPSYITPELAKTVAAAFPGGFRTDQSNVGSNGGYYDDGREATKPGPLRVGAASLVIYRDGTAKVGTWGSDVKPGPDVRSVRQNLDPLVQQGQVNPTCELNNSKEWGYTLGNNAYVPRTGLGMRADGTLIFVNSPATTVCSLGTLLKSAGVVSGMELDINPEWSIGYYFTHENGVTTPHISRPDQSQGPDHYFSPQSRDFVAFYLRP
jgi:hypothetical protein